jgi:hypothetical protein
LQVKRELIEMCYKGQLLIWEILTCLLLYYSKEYSLNLTYFSRSYISVPYLDLDHVELMIQLFKLHDVSDESLYIGESHLGMSFHGQCRNPTGTINT